jgi:hypothetical protein
MSLLAKIREDITAGEHGGLVSLISLKIRGNTQTDVNAIK